MAYIGQRPVIGRYIKLDQISSGFNGSNTGFSMTAGSQAVFPGTARNLLLSLGGVIQEPDTDFTISGSTLTFTTPPVANTTFFGVIYGDMQATGTPSDGTVLPASIASSGHFKIPQLTVNEDGADVDFRVEGDTEANLLFVDASTNRVGIGTNTPTGILEIDSSTTTDQLMFDVAGTNYARIGHNTSGGTALLDIRSEGHARLLTNGNNTAVFVNTSQHVGIGTTSPSYRLDLGDGTNGNDPASGYQFRINAYGDYIFTLARRSVASFSIRNNATSVVHLNTQNSKRLSLGVSTGSNSGSIEEQLNVISGGNVGIAITSPTKKLHINTTGTSGEGIILKATDDTYPSVIGDANRASSGLFLLAMQGFWNGTRVGEVTVESGPDTTNKDDGIIVLRTRGHGDSTPQDRLTVGSLGSVGIGTTTMTGKLNVQGPSGGIAVQTTDAVNSTFRISHPSSGVVLLSAGSGQHLALGSNFTEKIRMDSSGRLLIGTESSLSFNGVGQNHNLIVAGSTTDTDITDNSGAAITISNTDGTANNTAGLHFAREDTDGTPHYDGASIVAQFKETMNTGQYPKTDLAFLVAPANNNAPQEKMRLKAAGHLSLTTGNLEFASGAGIDFSAVSDGSRSVSTDGNKFDDYEEGTFTPTMFGSSTAGSPTYVHQRGDYTKVGNMVTINVNINVSNIGGAVGNMRIGGLPFTPFNQTEGITVAQWNQLGGGLPSGKANACPILQNPNTYVELRCNDNGGGAYAFLAVQTVSYLRFCMTYFT